METLYDVIRLAVDGLRAVGGITERDHGTARAIVDAEDPNMAAANAPTFNDTEAAELERLLAKQQAAIAYQGPGQYAQPPAPQQAPPPAAVPGAGFHQAPPPAVPQFFAPPQNTATAGHAPVFPPAAPQPAPPQPQQAPTFPLPVSQAQ